MHWHRADTSESLRWLVACDIQVRQHTEMTIALIVLLVTLTGCLENGCWGRDNYTYKMLVTTQEGLE